MTVNANGRAALMLAAGLLVGFAAGPSQAATSADSAAAGAKSENAGPPVALNKSARHASRHGKSYTHHQSGKAEKSTADKKPSAGETAAEDGDNSPAIPSSIANANAELAPVDSPTGDAARAMSARANEILQAAPEKAADAQPAAETQVVSADQLNDLDRALHAAPAPTLALASAEAPAASAPAATAANSGESSTWDQTSLIGKIFIGFGALLTMASAARMFMA